MLNLLQNTMVLSCIWVPRTLHLAVIVSQVGLDPTVNSRCVQINVVARVIVTLVNYSIITKRCQKAVCVKLVGEVLTALLLFAPNSVIFVVTAQSTQPLGLLNASVKTLSLEEIVPIYCVMTIVVATVHA